MNLESDKRLNIQRSAFRIFALSERVLPTLQIPKTGKGCTTGGRGARAVVDFLT